MDDEQIRLPDEEVEPEKPKRLGSLKRVYDKTYWLWIIIIVFDLVVQALRSASMSPTRKNIIDDTETVVTIVLFFEICVRFLCDWRNFHTSPRNWVDLGIAIITAVIQIPPIHQSGQPYAWLTFFQIVRIYRAVLAVSLTRQLIVGFSLPQELCAYLIGTAVDSPWKYDRFAESGGICVSDYVPHSNLCGPDISWHVPNA